MRGNKIKLSVRQIMTVVLFICCLVPAANAGHSKPVNIIIMIADGAGFAHINAAGLYQYGRTGQQVYEHFPVRLAVSTYPYEGSYSPDKALNGFDYLKSGWTDSAAAATAMSTGVKTVNQAIGIDSNKQKLVHLMECAEALGKRTGVVTSVPFAHATPAGFVAHNVSRYNYKAIGKEMILNSALDVIMGCGHPWYDDDGNLRNKPRTFKYVGGESVWTALKNGTAGADADQDGERDLFKLIETREEFLALRNGPAPRRVIGVPRIHQTLQQKRSGKTGGGPYRVPFVESVPTLEEMTIGALNVLDDDPDGFVLLVEGGAIDWAGHKNQNGRVIEETIEFNKAVESAAAWVTEAGQWEETLLIVTADHDTGFLTGSDGKDLIGKGKGVVPDMKWHTKKHTNALVPFFAKGATADKYKEKVIGYDKVHGPIIDNTSVLAVVEWEEDDNS